MAVTASAYLVAWGPFSVLCIWEMVVQPKVGLIMMMMMMMMMKMMMVVVVNMDNRYIVNMDNRYIVFRVLISQKCRQID